MNVGSPTHMLNGPPCLHVKAMAWKMFLYNMVPSANGFWDYIFVFALSKGKLKVAETIPAMRLDKQMTVGLLANIFESLSLDSSKEVRRPKFKAIALITVGTPPFQRVVNPSSLGILLAASTKFLYPLYSSLGRVLSVCIRMRIRSGGVLQKAPRAPATIEHPLFWAKEI